MAERVELEDGSCIPIGGLLRRVPHSIFWSSTHLEVCEWLASDCAPPPELRSVYVNLIFTKSDRAKEITALIELIRAGHLRAKRVFSKSIGPDFAQRLGGEVEIIRIGKGGRPPNLIALRSFVRFALKILSHRVFRMLGPKRLNAKRVIRSWVDTTDATFPDCIADDTTIIYPFAGSPSRQVRYLHHCRKTGRRMALVGLPYRLGDLVQLVLRWGQRDLVVASGELDAQRTHADELADSGVELVHTTDDFSVAAVALHNGLRDRGVRSVNRSHGIGVYGPYVSYSHYQFYNQHQWRFYRQRGEFESFDFRALAPTERHAPRHGGKPYDPVVVYVLGNWRQSRKPFEALLEQRALACLREVCSEQGLPLVAKVHPNVSFSGVLRTKLRHRVQVTRGLQDLEDRNPIFVLMMSTAYYSFLLEGPAIHLADDLLDPRPVFGDEVVCARVEELREVLAGFESAAHWSEQLSAQIERERRVDQEGRSQLG